MSSAPSFDFPVLVWGAGAIGGTVAAFLARAGVPVHAVDVVEDHVHAIRDHGLRISGKVAEFTQAMPAFLPHEVTGQYPLILLAVKAQHTLAATQALLPHLAPGGCIVSLQNGLNEKRIASLAGAPSTIAGLVNFAADYVEPGHIVYGSAGAMMLGEMQGGVTLRLEAIATLLQHFDPRARAVEDIWSYKWGKLAYGSLLFLTAVANETMYESLSDPEHGHAFQALAAEVIGVARAAGVAPVGFDGFVPDAFQAGAPADQARASLDAMGAHYRYSDKQRSGVWRDLAVRKRKTEIDDQIGEIVRVAAEHGMAAPVTAILIDMIHEIENGTRAQSRENLLEFGRRAASLKEPA